MVKILTVYHLEQAIKEFLNGLEPLQVFLNLGVMKKEIMLHYLHYLMYFGKGQEIVLLMLMVKIGMVKSPTLGNPWRECTAKAGT